MATATAQDILGWITELLSGQGLDAPGSTGADALAAFRGARRQGLGPPAPGAAGPLPPPPLAPRMPPDTFPAEATDVPQSITGAGTRRPPAVPGDPTLDMQAPRDVPPFTTGTVERAPDNPEISPDMARLIAANENRPFNPPPLAPRTPPARRERPDQRGFGDYALAFLSGLSGEGGLREVRRLHEGERGRNATYAAIMERGGSDALARAITENQALFAPILPQVFSPRTSIVNNRLVETATGRVIADFSTHVLGPGQNLVSGTGRTIASGGLEQPPSGFEWVDPTDRSRGLRATPGGPGTHISSDAAGRLALMDTARRGVADARRLYERNWGGRDLWRQFWANAPGVGDVGQLSGEQGQAQRNIMIAVESALRTMTGAAAPETEVRRYAEMFTPNARDTVESARQKLDALDAFMRRAQEIATQGRTADPPPAGPGQPRTRTYNPQTGRLE